MNKEEALTQIGAVLDKLSPAPDITPLIRITNLGRRVAQGYLSGQSNEGLDKVAQEVLDLMGDLPDELKGML